MKKFLSCLMALTMLLCTLTAYAAETNWDSGDGEDMGDAVNLQNAWLVYTDGGKCVNAAEGLRVTVYDAESESKVYNTVDITGNKYISAVSDMQFFADSYNGSPELIPKTTWLQSKWIGATYEDVSSSAVAKFNNAVIGRIEYGGYSPQYIPELDELDIISENNTANLEKIRKFVGKKEFLVHLCSIIDDLEYDDFADGKYKLAFEPVAYLSYAGVPWALTATECAVLNKYIVNTQGKGKGVLNYLAPLSHSQLPLSAFLTFKELGVAQFSATESDYTYSKNGSKVYYKDNCIIRSMGIGIVSGEKPEVALEAPFSTITSYHTDTWVYTSLTFYNDTENPYFGFRFENEEDMPINSYSYYNGKVKHISEFEVWYLHDEPYVVSENSVIKTETCHEYIGIYNEAYANMTSEQFNNAMSNLSESISRQNDILREQYNAARSAWYDSGKEGPEPVEPTYVSMPHYIRGGSVKFTITNSAGKVLANDVVGVCCPEGEYATVYLKWKTPSKPQRVTISVSTSAGQLSSGEDFSENIEIEAEVVKVNEITPPDPTVYDKRPSWHRIYNEASVAKYISAYTTESTPQLSWNEWSCEWAQDEINNNYFSKYYGVNEVLYKTIRGTDKDTSIIPHDKAVEVTGFKSNSYTVGLSAEMIVKPADECKTATYSSSAERYTMKSGYGIQVEIDSHLTGNGTEFCTGTQIANVLFPEFNYNRQGGSAYNRLLERVGNNLVFKQNEYSTYKSRVHFTPIWYPDNSNYTVYAEVFDVWCPAGQLSVRLTDAVRIKGNVYDDWHVAPMKVS